jgi:hypothetical protein
MTLRNFSIVYASISGILGCTVFGSNYHQGSIMVDILHSKGYDKYLWMNCFNESKTGDLMKHGNANTKFELKLKNVAFLSATKALLCALTGPFMASFM